MTGPIDATQGTTWTWYVNAGRRYNLTARQVAALVRKHALPKRKVWGSMAVESGAWARLMAKEKVK